MFLSIQENCECVFHGNIEQEEAIEYKIEYCEVNYYEYENKKKVDCIKPKICLIDSVHFASEIIEDKKVEHCEVNCYECEKKKTRN